jgi:hypothetical protein
MEREITLDLVCAEYGDKFSKEKGIDETSITKSIGILKEDGVYAFFLYLASKGLTGAQGVAFQLMKDGRIPGHVTGSDGDPLKAVRESLSGNLGLLLFFKELLERTLVYARYHAKASDKQKPPEIEGDGE